jgi:hypothetical protein
VIQTAAASASQINMPGMMPPANSRPIETWPIVPYRMKPIPGGMIGVISEPNDRMPAAKPRDMPRLTMS